MRRFGSRNVADLVLVATLFPVERLMDGGIVEPEDGAGLGLALALLTDRSLL